MAVSFRDADGTTRLSGDLLASGGATGDVLTQQADGTYAPAAGGAAPTTHEAFAAGANTSVAESDFVELPWGVHDSGDTLLDLSTPTTPTIITAGVYACTVRVIGLNLTPGGFYIPTLNFDNAGADQFVFTDCTATAANPSASVSLSLTYYCPVNAQLAVSVTNLDGVSSRLFAVTSAYLQRLA